MRNAIAALALVTLAVTGCGGGDDDGADKFRGRWSYTSGTSLVTCQGFDPTTSALAPGNITITKAVAPGADLLYSEDTCNFLFKVIGSNASILQGQTCTMSDAAGGTLNLTATAWNLNTVDGSNMNESGSATATYLTGGSSFPCSITVTGSLMKIGV